MMRWEELGEEAPTMAITTVEAAVAVVVATPRPTRWLW